MIFVLFSLVSCKDSVDRLFGFDLTLEANDGTGTKTTVRINGADGKVPECPFSREGYTFYKWNTKQDGSGTSYEEGDAFQEDKSHTLYAQWSFDLTLEAKTAQQVEGVLAGGVVAVNIAPHTFQRLGRLLHRYPRLSTRPHRIQPPRQLSHALRHAHKSERGTADTPQTGASARKQEKRWLQ